VTAYEADLLCKSQNLLLTLTVVTFKSNQNQMKSNYFIVRLKVDQRAGQLSLPHLGITKTEKIELKHITDERNKPAAIDTCKCICFLHQMTNTF